MAPIPFDIVQKIVDRSIHSFPKSEGMCNTMVTLLSALTYLQLKKLIYLSGINKTFYHAVFSKSSYWRSIRLWRKDDEGEIEEAATCSFEPIFRRVFTSDLSFHAENTLISLDLSMNDIAKASTVVFVIDKILLLEEFLLYEATRIDLNELYHSLVEWRNKNKFYDDLMIFSGRKIKLKNIQLERCGYNVFNTPDEFHYYWGCSYVGYKSPVGPLKLISGVLNDICEEESCTVEPDICFCCADCLSYFSSVNCQKCGEVVNSLCNSCDTSARISYICIDCRDVAVHSRCTDSGIWTMREWDNWRCNDCVMKLERLA
jgi:hypothetical protein